MKRFLKGTDEAFAGLRRQAAAAAFVQFTDAELPPGCVPPRSRIGIKVDARTDACVLYVDHGVRYYGPDENARRWFRDGELLFPTFDALRSWLTADLKALFDTPVDIEAPPGEASEDTGTSPSGTCATSALPSPGAPASVLEPNPPPAIPVAVPAEPTAPPRDTPPQDEPVTGRLVELVVRQIGAKHGVEVRTIDPVLVTALTKRLRAASPDDDPEAPIEEAVGGALALAAVEYHRAVAITAGPPITCTSLDKP